jgi:hypothetical protein
VAINLVSVNSSRPIEWIRQAAGRINQALTWINQKNSRTNVSGTYTVQDEDFYLGLQSGAFTVTLSGAIEGRQLVIKDEAGDAGTNTKTISGTVDGGSTTITTNYGSLHLISDGTNWFTI